MKEAKSVQQILNSESFGGLKDDENYYRLSNSSRNKNDVTEHLLNPYTAGLPESDRKKDIESLMKLRCLTKTNNLKKNKEDSKTENNNLTKNIDKKSKSTKREKFGSHLNNSFKKKNPFKCKKINSTDDKIQNILNQLLKEG